MLFPNVSAHFSRKIYPKSIDIAANAKASVALFIDGLLRRLSFLICNTAKTPTKPNIAVESENRSFVISRMVSHVFSCDGESDVTTGVGLGCKS